jgi:cellulose synthase/poly-beta-1,6-N-acetylglucosamine synthase-like glycosyltransferase
MEQLPLVSIIVPCRNEAGYLERSLGALRAQDYPAGRMEIIVADGMSEDGSDEIARSVLAGAEQAWKVLPNTERITAAAFNLGLEHARGDVIVIASAHCELAPDYVRLAVATLERTGADCVGGPVRTHGETAIARAIALALSSTFGVGGSMFRTRRDHSGFVDTVPFGAYRRDVFERVGAFDPGFVRNQDAELNFRITRSGGRIWLEPTLRSVYYSRATLGALWRQHFHTGASKVQILAKHGRMPRWGHYVPGAFVLATATAVLLAIVLRRPIIVLAIVVPYAVVALAATIWASRSRLYLAPLVAIAMPTLHLSYGLGSLYSAGRIVRRGAAQAGPTAPREAPRRRTRS